MQRQHGLLWRQLQVRRQWCVHLPANLHRHLLKPGLQLRNPDSLRRKRQLRELQCHRMHSISYNWELHSAMQQRCLRQLHTHLRLRERLLQLRQQYGQRLRSFCPMLLQRLH